MYEPLVKAFHMLTEDFPAAKSLTFLNYSNFSMRFPYMSRDPYHRQAKTDLTVSYPGTAETLCAPRWSDISLAIDVKPCQTDDPTWQFSKEHANTVMGLVSSGHNLLMGHMGLFAFLINIFGHRACIFRFDHSSVIASPQFNYVQRPELLKQFFWNFVNPLLGTAISGVDPLVTVPTNLELAWARNLDQGKVETENGEIMIKGFLTVKLLFIDPCLFSRSTMIWSAIERDDESGEQYVIKDSWQPQDPQSETVYYSHILKTLREQNEHPFGLAVVQAGIDLGVKEDNERMEPYGPPPEQPVLRKPPSHGLDSSSAPLASSSSRTGDVDLFSLSPLSALPSSPLPTKNVNLFSLSPLSLPPPSPATTGNVDHFSLSPLSPPPSSKRLWITVPESAYRNPTNSPELSQVFFECAGRSPDPVNIQTPGIPLSKFPSTKRVVDALCGAIEGRQRACSGGVLRRDVSEGDVYMIDGKPYKGCIGDSDYSSFVQTLQSGHDDLTRPDANPNESLKERMGTHAFVAIKLLDNKGIIHDAHHDLESFYWLFIWLVIRHTVHADPEGMKAHSLMFLHENDHLCANMKRGWLISEDQYLSVPGNASLTWMLKEFTILCRVGNFTLRGPPVLLTHDAVTGKFEAALNMDGWSEDDRALPLKPNVDSEEVSYTDPANIAMGEAVKRLKDNARNSEQGQTVNTVQDKVPMSSSKRKREPEEDLNPSSKRCKSAIV
ncbi:hypothetical protein BKA93DRAFT_878237 [Sparassis latifolia]